MQVIWTEKATVSFNEIADYLHWKFQQREVEKFFDRTDEIINNVLLAPYLFKPYDGNPQIRHGILHKSVTLFYRVLEDDDTIEILLFWNNHKSPEKLNLI